MTEMATKPHWTDCLGEFAYWVSSDYAAQIETRMEVQGVSQSTLADRLDVSPSRVSQVLNDPGNLTLGNVVKYARALEMKVALVTYDDGDPENLKGPISADVFTKCWERMGKPKDFFELENITLSRGCWVLTKTISAVNDREEFRDVKVEKTAAADTYGAFINGGERRQSA